MSSAAVAVAESVADGSLGDACQSGGLLDACALLDEVAGDEFLGDSAGVIRGRFRGDSGTVPKSPLLTDL